SDDAKINWWEKALDFGMDVLSGTISGIIVDRYSPGKKTKNRTSPPNIRGNAGEPTTKSKILTPETAKKSQTLIDVNERPLISSQTQVSASPSAPKTGKGKGLISFGKNI